ncbi:hypothetical protein TWF694_010018 [Orbilia ellipsospora]|uniref:Peptidase A1 domain-containing protein n=1 Tax=Orbilia ellipsospora TaxID=2528407 RepID=A0AAV9X8M3_9PEZI
MMGSLSLGITRIILFLALAFSFFAVVQSSSIAAAKPTVNRPSELQLQARQAEKNYVVLPARYDYFVLGTPDGNLYSDVTFGTSTPHLQISLHFVPTEMSFLRDTDQKSTHVIIGRQPLRLALMADTVSWVPELPASRNEFCSDSRNTEACKIASVSDYYSPGDIPRNDTFDYAPFFFFTNKSATGYWVEDVVVAGGVSVDLRFGVAQSWNLVPSLGLGVWPISNYNGRPSYLAALQQQGKIVGQYCSCYNLTDSDSSTVILGGVDLDKFSGKLKVWDNFERTGIVDSPSAQIIQSNNVTSISKSEIPTALVFPGTPLLYLPQNVLDAISSIIPARFTASAGMYTIPCGTRADASWFLELSFSGLAIKIPFENFLTNVATQEDGMCFTLLSSSSSFFLPGYRFSYILGGVFLRSAYLILNANENITAIGVANTDVTTENIVELGGQFGYRIREIEGTAPTALTNPTTKSKKPSGGAIAGGVVGGIVWGILLCIGVVFWHRRRQKKRPTSSSTEENHPELPGEDRRTNELDGWSGYSPANKGRTAGETEYSELANLPPEYRDDDRHQQMHELPG